MALAYGGRRHRQYRAALVQPHEIQPTNNGLLLTGQDTLLRGVGGQLAYDWPNPPRGRLPGVVTNRTIAQGLVTTTLLGQDTVWGAPGQAADYDWTPRPVAVKRQQPPDPPNLQVIQPAAPVEPPPNDGWTHPNPRGRENRVRPVEAEPGVWQNLQGTLQFVDAGAPVEPFDWPLPVPDRRRTSPVNRSWWVDLVTTTLFGQDSFYGAGGQAVDYDWQLPPRGRPAGAVSNRSLWVDLVTTTLRGQDRIYAGPGQVPVYLWTVPKGYKRSHPPQIFVDLINTLIFVPPPVITEAPAYATGRFGLTTVVDGGTLQQALVAGLAARHATGAGSVAGHAWVRGRGIPVPH